MIIKGLEPEICQRQKEKTRIFSTEKEAAVDFQKMRIPIVNLYGEHCIVLMENHGSLVKVPLSPYSV